MPTKPPPQPTHPEASNAVLDELTELWGHIQALEDKIDAITAEIREIKRAVTEPHNPTWFNRGGK